MNNTNVSSDGILLQSGTNEVEFIEFFIGEVSYGINVSKVQRVLALSSVTLTRIAQAPPAVLGVVHIQEKPVVLMDLRKALNIESQANSRGEDRQLILVTKFNKITTAFLIDAISKIHRTSWTNFEPITEQVTSETQGSFSTGTVTLDDNIIVILDLERMMLTHFPHSHSHSIESVKVVDREGRDNVNIVYAEDSHMVRKITINILKEAGYKNVADFENGSEAFEYIEREAQRAKQDGVPLNSRIHLLLTDIEMPRMDGLTLCRQVKSEIAPNNPPKVIVYSSLINREMSAKCHSVGADAQLAKPEVELIVELVDKLCIELAD